MAEGRTQSVRSRKWRERREAMESQPLLFPEPVTSRENEGIYSAIEFLRGTGAKIRRVSGTQARVDGKLRSNREIMKLATVGGWVGPKRKRRK